MSATAPPDGTGSSSPGQPAGVWTEHRNAQGRVYWYHKVEKRSVWEKPSELKTARERAIDSTPWREYQKGDRKYYVHSVTKESSWSMPKELKDLIESVPNETSPQPAPPQREHRDTQSPHPMPLHRSGQQPIYTGPPPGFESPGHAVNGSSSPAASMRAVHAQASAPPPVASAPANAQRMAHVVPNQLVAGGEEAFVQLLRDKGVDTTWTWEQTMRETITDPMYKALKTLAERKAAFSKYVQSLEEEAEQAKKQKAKAIEPSIRKMMDAPVRSKRIEHWLSYEGMLLRCPDPSPWRKLEAVSAKESAALWETMRDEMREQESQKARELRRRNKDTLVSLLRSFEADVTTRWKDAYQTVLESDEWKSDASLRTIDVEDMLAAFDDVMKTMEDEKRQEVTTNAKQNQRDERKRRDWLRQALQDGKRAGWLTVRTTFGDVYARLNSEDILQQMLGQRGSSPLDLFHDVMDELEVELEKLVRAVESVLESSNPAVRVRDATTLDEFKKVLDASISGSSSAASETIREASQEQLETVHAELVHRSREESRRIERKLRHLSEDVRYALKKVAHHRPEIFGDEEELDKGWDEWKERINALHLREWDEFERTPFRIDGERIEQARKAAWERFVVRQKEKLAERRAAVAAATANASHDEGSLLADGGRKRRGEDGEVEGNEQNAAARKSSRDATRRERRAGYLDEPSAAKRLRKDGAEEEEEESEKEEGEV